jgi:hypothetical protein
MNNTDNSSGSETGTRSQRSSGTPFFKTWGFWIGVIVLLGGFVIYVRTWTQAVHLDFKPEINPPPPVAAPAQR